MIKSLNYLVCTEDNSFLILASDIIIRPLNSSDNTVLNEAMLEFMNRHGYVALRCGMKELYAGKDIRSGSMKK